jgi:hypothetical protein
MVPSRPRDTRKDPTSNLKIRYKNPSGWNNPYTRDRSTMDHSNMDRCSGNSDERRFLHLPSSYPVDKILLRCNNSD